MARLHRILANAIITNNAMTIASRKIKSVNKHWTSGLNLHKLDRWKYNGMKNKFTQIRQRHGNKNVAHKDTFCCKTKFTQIGTRYGQTYLIPNIQAYMQVAHKDTFFKTPVHFGGGQEMEMLTGVMVCLWLQCCKENVDTQHFDMCIYMSLQSMYYS